MGGRDDFVTRADAGSEERQVQGARSAARPDGMRRSGELREVGLERGHLFAEDVLPVLEHAEDRGIDLGLDRTILGFEIDEREHETSPR